MMIKRRLLALVLALTLALSLFSATASANGDERDLSDGYELLMDGQNWKAYAVESREEVLTLDRMNITLVDRDGNEVDPDVYELRFEVKRGWDEDNNRPITEPFTGELKIEGNEEEDPGPGFASFCIYALAKEGSGCSGRTDSQDFMVWHRYSFNWFGANASFGEEYKRQCTWSWHDYFEIPVGETDAPEVYGIALEEPIDPAYYTLTYFNRVTGVPVSDGDDYQDRVYPMGENDELALDGMPTQPGSYFVRIDGKTPYYGTSFIDFDIVVPSLDDAELRFDGQNWKAYAVDSTDQVMSLDDLHITLVDGDGNPVDPDAYELCFEVQKGWDDDNDCPRTEPFTGELKIEGNEEEDPGPGFANFRAYAVAKEGSGYTGSTEPQNFMLWHRYSFNWFGANASFGGQYQCQSTWSWHDYFAIPLGREEAPKVYGIAQEEPIDPAYYTLTYFNRVTGVPVSDGDDYQDRVYPMGEDDELALEGMPTEPGSYFVRIDGKAPYYGTSFIDFDLLSSYAFEHGDDYRYYNGDVIYLTEGEELYLGFDLEPYNGLIPGWRNDLLGEQGFEIDDQPAWFDGDDYAYAHIRTGSKQPGDVGVLTYNWYRFDDIFGEHAVGWQDAVPVLTATLRIQVVQRTPMRLLGDADGNESVSIIDATVIQRYLVGEDTSRFVLLTADVNRNGVIDVLDATLIQRWLAGFSTEFAINENVNYSTGFAFWDIEQEILPQSCDLTGEARERAREEIRQAFSLLIDRSAAAATQPEKSLPASSFIPKWITDADGSEFHRAYYDAKDIEGNVAAAIETLKQYYTYDEQSGTFTDVPQLTYLFNEVEPVRAIAEELQRDFAAVGIDLVLDARDWSEYADATAAKGYSFARAGWAMGLDDPMVFLEEWTSRDNLCGFGQGAYEAAAIYSLDLTPYGVDYSVANGTWAQTYDVLIDEINRCEDRADAYAMMHLAEDMLMNTGCIIPFFYY